LAYLALGDWHGRMPIGAATWYCGTPEPDSFKHAGRGAVNLVVDGQVTEVPVGTLGWHAPRLDLIPGDDVVARVAAVLPPLAARAGTLLSLRVAGRLSLPETGDLARAFDAIAPDHLFAEVDLADLVTVPQAGDLDLIDHAGALRLAAERRAAEAEDPARDEAGRAVAAAALARLFAYATADGA
jgi:hypothetical protein